VSLSTSARIFLAALNFTIARAGIGTSVSGALGLRPTGLANFDFEDAEVAEFHLVALGERPAM